jgi:L-amino acid N-acyltransferase YncA
LLNEIIAQGTFLARDKELTKEDQHAFLRAFPSHGIFHIAFGPDTQILGIQGIVPLAEPKAFAHFGAVGLFVRQDAQGKGMGRALCEATFEADRGNGFEKVMATVQTDKAQAVAFCRSQGFRLIGTLEQHARIRGKDVDPVLWERFL